MGSTTHSKRSSKCIYHYGRLEYWFYCRSYSGIFNMKPEEYGEKYLDHRLEQYKLYVEMADRVSQRREQANRFYLSVVAAIVALLVVLVRFDLDANIRPIVFLISGLFGVALSIIWCVNIGSYRQLNEAKYSIINRMEEQLPAAGHTDEWEMLRPKEGKARYFQLTKVERFVPITFLLLFLALSVYGIAMQIK